VLLKTPGNSRQKQRYLWLLGLQLEHCGKRGWISTSKLAFTVEAFDLW